jgi:DNA-binding NtrC family response regulator
MKGRKKTMASPTTIAPGQQGALQQPRNPGQGCVLIFSADKDLAESLTMLVEDRFPTRTETDLKMLPQRIQDCIPSVLLVDLLSSPEEGLSQIRLLEKDKSGSPVILLRNYRSNPEMDAAIRKLGAYVFFKPVDVEVIRGLIMELSEKKTNNSTNEVV